MQSTQDPRMQQAPAKPWHREPLDAMGTAVQQSIKAKYDILWHAPSGLLGRGYIGFVQGSQHAPVFVSVQRHDESDPGWTARRDEIIRIKESIIASSHPAIWAPRDIFEVPEQNATAFIFDAPDQNAVTLRQFLRGLHQDPDDKVVGALFTPIVAGLQFLEQKSLLPPFARVDIDSCFVYPDGTIRLLHPAVALHGDKGHHHAHKKLEKRLKKIDKQVDKGDKAAAGERDDLYERFIIADLSLLLFEIMTRKLTHWSRHKMVHDAKKMNKRDNFSKDLTQLLVDLLQAGRTPKKELVTIDDIMRREIIQRFLSMLIMEGSANTKMSEIQKAIYLRGFQQQQVFGGWHAGRGKWRASGEKSESVKRRRQMVRGKGQRLSGLQDKPLEKRNGVRFDLPFEGEAPFALPEGRRQPVMSREFSGQLPQQQFQQQQFEQQPQQAVGGQRPVLSKNVGLNREYHEGRGQQISG